MNNELKNTYLCEHEDRITREVEQVVLSRD